MRDDLVWGFRELVPGSWNQSQVGLVARRLKHHLKELGLVGMAPNVGAAVHDVDGPMQHRGEREGGSVEALLPGRQVEPHALPRRPPQAQPQFAFPSLGALDELFRPAIQRLDQRVVPIRPAARARGRAAAEEVTEAPCWSANQGESTDRWIGDGHGQRDRCSLAVSDDSRTSQVELAA